MDRAGALKLWEVTPGETLEERVVNFAHRMEYAYNAGHVPDLNALADLLAKTQKGEPGE